jgi:hypothetical protein
MLLGKVGPVIQHRWRGAVILETPNAGSDARQFLDRAAARFVVECKIIKAAASVFFPEVFDLLGPASSRWMPSRVVPCNEACRQFDRRLAYAENETLRALLSLLNMPSPALPLISVAA